MRFCLSLCFPGSVTVGLHLQSPVTFFQVRCTHQTFSILLKGANRWEKLHLAEWINRMQGIWMDATFWHYTERLAELPNHADAKTGLCEKVALLLLSLSFMSQSYITIPLISPLADSLPWASSLLLVWCLWCCALPPRVLLPVLRSILILHREMQEFS